MTPINDDTAVIPLGEEAPASDALDETRDDSLAEELAKAAPKRWWNTATVVLAGIVLLVGGFVGGLEAQKHFGTAATTTARGGSFTGQNRGTGGYGFPGGGSFGGGQRPGGANPTATAAAAGTTGTVKLVDGTTIYLQTPDGNVVTVKTDGRTTVSTAAKGKLTDVKAGQSVTVQGATGTDGTVSATSVTAQK